MNLEKFVNKTEEKSNEDSNKKLHSELKLLQNQSLYATMRGPYMKSPWGLIKKSRWRSLNTVPDYRARTQAKETIKTMYKEAKTWPRRKIIGEYLGSDRTILIKNMLQWGYNIFPDERFELWVHRYSPETGEKINRPPKPIPKKKSKLKRLIAALCLTSCLSGCFTTYHHEGFDLTSGKNRCANKVCPGHRYIGERCRR